MLMLFNKIFFDDDHRLFRLQKIIQFRLILFRELSVIVATEFHQLDPSPEKSLEDLKDFYLLPVYLHPQAAIITVEFY